MTPEIIINLKGVSTTYEGEGNPSITGIDLQVSRGEWVCIVGPNGSGKTTLLETVNGYLPYSSGSGNVFGMEIRTNLNYIRTRTGYVIQNFEIDPLSPFLCRDVVMTARSAKIGSFRFTGKEDWLAVDEALDIVGMRDFSNRPVGKLSGGEYQKILLARAIAKEPELLLLDEPFSNMDFDSRNLMHRTLSGMVNEKHLTILMVSHGLDTIPEACQRIVVMKGGRIVMDGPKSDILGSDKLASYFTNGSAPGVHSSDHPGRVEHV